MNKHRQFSDEDLLREMQELPTQLSAEKRREMLEKIDRKTRKSARIKTRFAFGGSAVGVVAVVLLMIGSWLHSNNRWPQVGGEDPRVTNGAAQQTASAAPHNAANQPATVQSAQQGSSNTNAEAKQPSSASASPSANGTLTNSNAVNDHATSNNSVGGQSSTPKSLQGAEQVQQSAPQQANGVDTSLWRAIGPFFWVQGKITQIDATSPAWTTVTFQVDGFSQLPDTVNNPQASGKTEIVDFYNLADHGANHLQVGQQVMFRVADYSCPDGKMVLGCLYQNVYYQTDHGYVNTAGAVAPNLSGK